MELLTKELETKFENHPLFSQENKPQKEILVKYFTPWSSWTWYIVEAKREGDDWIMFGYVVSGLGEDCNVWGYTSLKVLQSIVGPMSLSVERDLYFGEHLIDQDGTIS